jgi:RNA polymerase sigma-70 factor (ECF subfamily)
MTPSLSADPLLARLASGDEAALGEMLAASWTPLVQYLGRLLASQDAAADAAQEAFVRLWEHRERWTAGSARALIFRIGRNAALDLQRRAEARRRHLPDPQPSPPTPADDLERARLVERCSAALASLPERRREVFELVRLSGLTHREAAEALGLSPQTVANTMSLALKDLRELLADAATERPRSTGGSDEEEAKWTS